MTNATHEGYGTSTLYQQPEFYPNGVVISITRDGKTVDVHRDGEALLYYDKAGVFGNVNVLRTPEEFREAFPYGLPAEEELLEWSNNAWFDLYSSEGEHLDRVTMSLEEAIESAEIYLEQN